MFLKQYYLGCGCCRGNTLDAGEAANRWLRLHPASEIECW